MEAHSVRWMVELVAGTTDTPDAARIRTAVVGWLSTAPETIASGVGSSMRQYDYDEGEEH